MEYREYNNILFEAKEGIGYVTMNRPKALNALNTEVVAELDELFTKIEADEESLYEFRRHANICRTLLRYIIVVDQD